MPRHTKPVSEELYQPTAPPMDKPLFNDPGPCPDVLFEKMAYLLALHSKGCALLIVELLRAAWAARMDHAAYVRMTDLTKEEYDLIHRARKQLDKLATPGYRFGSLAADPEYWGYWPISNYLAPGRPEGDKRNG